MIKSKLFAKSILVIITLLSIINMLYAQGTSDIAKELIQKNKVKSLKVFLNTQGIKGRKFTNFEELTTFYNKEGNPTYYREYIHLEHSMDFTNTVTYVYDSLHRLTEKYHTTAAISGTATTNYPLAQDEKSKTIFKYDSNSNCIASFSIDNQNLIKPEEEYVYDKTNKKIKKIKYEYKNVDTLLQQGKDTTITISIRDTTYYQYNSKNQCVEERKKGDKTIYEYNKQGLLSKWKSYSEGMASPLSTFLFFYNPQNQLIKKEFYMGIPFGNEVIKQITETYSYYPNGLVKEKREKKERQDGVFIFTSVYEYWD